MRLCRLRLSLSGPAVLAAFLLLLSLSACGKKGPLSLASYEKPDAPSLLAVRHRQDAVILSWSYPEAKERTIRGFLVVKSSGGEFGRLVTTEVGARTLIDPAVTDGTRYRYKVFAQSLRGILSEASNTVTILPREAPLPPRGISLRPSGDSLELTWKASEKGASYNIYRSFEKGRYSPVPLNTSPIAATEFRDSLFAGRLAYYTIRALSEDLDEGAASEEITADPAAFIPPAPTGLRCVAAQGRIYLYWNEPGASWIRGFRVYRSSAPEKYVPVGETQIPSFVDPDTSAGERAYRVTALGPVQEGPAAELRSACSRSE